MQNREDNKGKTNRQLLGLSWADMAEDDEEEVEENDKKEEGDEDKQDGDKDEPEKQSGAKRRKKKKDAIEVNLKTQYKMNDKGEYVITGFHTNSPKHKKEEVPQEEDMPEAKEQEHEPEEAEKKPKKKAKSKS